MLLEINLEETENFMKFHESKIIGRMLNVFMMDN